MTSAEARRLIEALDQHDRESQAAIDEYTQRMGQVRSALRNRLQVLVSAGLEPQLTPKLLRVSSGTRDLSVLDGGARIDLDRF